MDHIVLGQGDTIGLDLYSGTVENIVLSLVEYAWMSKVNFVRETRYGKLEFCHIYSNGIIWRENYIKPMSEPVNFSFVKLQHCICIRTQERVIQSKIEFAAVSYSVRESMCHTFESLTTWAREVGSSSSWYL